MKNFWKRLNLQKKKTKKKTKEQWKFIILYEKLDN